MEETVSTDLVVRFLRATPQQRTAFDRFLRATPEQRAAIDRFLLGGNAETLKAETLKTEGEPARFVFRKTGRRWEVIFGSRPFRLRNTLGARYLNYLLHEPNEAIRAFDLEVEVQPEKGEARSGNSIQPESDPQAVREYRQALRRLEAERADAQAAGDREEVEGLNGQIVALESALKAGGGGGDTGQRARDNVRKAIGAVMEKLSEGGPEERAFAEHLRTYLSIGHECLYSQPQGRTWD